VWLPGIGKTESDLSDNCAILAKHAWDVQSDTGLFPADRQCVKPAQLHAASTNVFALTRRAAQGMFESTL
jgi:hypothetical protein